MRARALWVGIVVSVLLLGAAGVLYVRASGGAEAQYREAIGLVRQIQHLSSQWSVEVARVKSDPLADFDALAGFVPRMARLKAGLRERARGAAGLPERVVSDINVYLSALDAKEERVERFKTGYAVVRNSARYLPLAAANVTRQAQEADEEALARRVAVLVQDMNLYLSNPTQSAGVRLGEELEGLREASVVHPPALANAVANLVSHAEVLLERQGPTEELFAGATSGDIAELSERVAGALEFELDRQVGQSAGYERALLGVIVALALFWVGLAVQQRGRGSEPRRAAPVRSSEAPEAPDALDAAAGAEARADDAAGGLRAAMLAAAEPEAPDAPVAGEPAETRALLDPAPAPVAPAEADAQAALRHGFLARCVADSLAASASRIATRMDYLRQTQTRIQSALREHDALLPALDDGSDLDEEIEAAGAIATGVRREMNTVADLARRLAATSALPNGALDRDMVDLNACVEEVLRATGAEDAATVDRRLGAIPEIFASRAEIRLLLTQVIDNALHAVEGLEGRAGTIKVDTARRNDDILVTVIDNGRGISADRRAKIFRPFYTSRDGALGLGLTLARHLAAQYEGDVKVNSLPGQGTVTRITLPAGIPGL